ncbi:MAG: NAD(P)/FAD-dependent oxidoreductase [Nitrospirota bacterium]
MYYRKTMHSNVIIIGAGAAGLMCAIEAGKRGRTVIILDHASKAGRKILISGGGRCNFTNLNMRPDNYLSANPHFCKSALARFTPRDFISLIEKHRISWREKEDGQIFCAGSSRQIADMLGKECDSAEVQFRLNCRIEKITKNSRFSVKTNTGVIETESLVIATGGLSYPSLKATGLGHRLAAQFGLRIIRLKPALVPLTFSRSDLQKFADLSGVSVKSNVRCNNKEFSGNILFTHMGLSGPAILQISSYWKKGSVIHIDLLPDIDIHEKLIEKRQSRMQIKNLLAQYFPKRFIHKWCELHIKSKPLCRYADKELEGISERLRNWEIKPEGTEGYNRAEVTLGGVDTDELSSKTMEAKKVPGLYFIGEVIDVTGQLGGYNLHWAWASGYAAGQYV